MEFAGKQYNISDNTSIKHYIFKYVGITDMTHVHHGELILNGIRDMMYASSKAELWVEVGKRCKGYTVECNGRTIKC